MVDENDAATIRRLNDIRDVIKEIAVANILIDEQQVFEGGCGLCPKNASGRPVNSVRASKKCSA